MNSIKIFLLCCVVVLYGMFAPVGYAGNIATWLDYSSKPVSPVARKADFFRMHGNGFLCGGDVTHTVGFYKISADEGYGVEWKTSSLKLLSPRGYATIRIPLPDNFVGKVAGVEFELFASSATDLKVELLKGTKKDFWNYKSRRFSNTNPFNISIKNGAGKYQILWKDIGVPVGAVGAVSLIRNDVGTIYIKKINLIFDNQKESESFVNAENKKYKDTVPVMVDWLAECGIDLSDIFETDSVKDTEKLAWQGVSLLALEPQIKYWSELAKVNEKKSSLMSLTRKKNILIEKLQKDIDISEELAELQKQVSGEIDRILGVIPKDKRRWSIDGDRFKDPAGNDYLFCGAHWFRSLYMPERYPLNLIEPDVRYLAGLGFNGLRLHVVWKHLEPVQGEFNIEYLNMLRRICREAERYGIGVSIDLHWPYPDWFCDGDPRYPVEGKLHYYDLHNPYHWPDALVDSWGRLAAAMSDIVNIVGWEVPTNEPGIGNSPNGLKSYPALLALWNGWLKKEYGTREKLNKVWSANGTRYALCEGESWDNSSIEPLGWQGDADAAEAYAHNPRVWDHIKWAASMQSELSGRIMTAVRKSVPGAVGMMQPTVGDRWDLSPVPIDYHGIQTMFGEHVNPGSHYGLGGIQQYKAASLRAATYNSEQQMENNKNSVIKQVKQGGGFTAFAFHRWGGGGMLFVDDDWHLKAEVAYLPAVLRWAKRYKIPQKSKASIAVISNTRLEATVGTYAGKLYEQLTDAGYQVDLFEGLRVVRQPELLNGCKVVLAETGYMDLNLLDVLDNNYTGTVFLYGSIDRDAYGRENVIAEEFKKRGIFLKDANIAKYKNPDSIDISGLWDCFFSDDSTIPPHGAIKSFEHGEWKRKSVPGKWGEMELIGSLKYRLGNAWYKKQIIIPESWKGKTLLLNVGAIDDFDWAYFNGKLIGHTDSSKANYWKIPRKYTIDKKIVKWGKPNELLICVHNNNGDGGIVKGPVEILLKESKGMRIILPGEVKSIVFAPSQNCSFIKESQLRPDSKVITKVHVPGYSSDMPALIKQGRWMWWCDKKIPPQIAGNYLKIEEVD